MEKQIQTTSKKKWICALVIIILVIITTGSYHYWNANQVVDTVTEPVKADARVLATGFVVPVRYMQITMPENNTVSEILVTEGEQVRAGQPIIRLRRDDSQAQVQSNKSDAIRAAAAVEQGRVNLAEAERELARQQRMEPSGATSRQLIDQAKAAVERNQAILAQAQATLETVQGKTSQSEQVVNKKELRAPFDGVVSFLDAKAGENYNSGAVLARIADPSAWEVKSDDLTELVVAKIQVGDCVTLTFDGIPDLEIPGKVKYIRKYGEKKHGDITYTTVITPDFWDERLCWMMTSQIAITPR